MLDEKSLKTGETKHVENDLTGCATDVITGFYYLQSLPLQPGAVYEFPISDGKTTMVHASVEKREQIKVPAGTFPTVLVTAEATSGPLQSKGKVWVWYSDDPNHIPVQMRVEAGMGHAAVSPVEDREVETELRATTACLAFASSGRPESILLIFDQDGVILRCLGSLPRHLRGLGRAIQTIEAFREEFQARPVSAQACSGRFISSSMSQAFRGLGFRRRTRLPEPFLLFGNRAQSSDGRVVPAFRYPATRPLRFDLFHRLGTSFLLPIENKVVNGVDALEIGAGLQDISTAGGANRPPGK